LRKTTGPRRGGQPGNATGPSLIGITAEQAITTCILCAGNPDTVYKQIMDIYEGRGVRPFDLYRAIRLPRPS
jgi:hypothetical protein